jgi:hypothetical protein
VRSSKGAVRVDSTMASPLGPHLPLCYSITKNPALIYIIYGKKS